MEQYIPHDAPAGRPFGHRGVVVPSDLDPTAHYVLTDSLDPHPDGATLVVAGTILTWQRHITRQGRAWASGTLRLDAGEFVDFHVFPDPYTACGGYLVEGERRVLHIRLDRRVDPPTLNVRAVNLPDVAAAEGWLQ